MSIFGWILIQQRVAGVYFDWMLSWNSYKLGFGLPRSNFWLGLETIHQLTTSQSYRVRFEVQQQTTGMWFSAEYWTFIVSDELSAMYRITIEG
jgi:Fibrinogen beta and gamma chains, C-terminal globular domain